MLRKKMVLWGSLIATGIIGSTSVQAVAGMGIGVRGGWVNGYKNPAVAGQLAPTQASLPKQMQMFGLHVKLGTMPVLDLEGSLEYAWKEKQFTYLSNTYNFRLSDISANATAEYVLPFPVLKPHVGAGLGLHRVAYSVKSPQTPYPVPVPGDETKVGYHALVGVTFHPPLFSLEFFGDWRYTWVTTTGKQTRYSTLLAGVTLGLP